MATLTNATLLASLICPLCRLITIPSSLPPRWDLPTLHTPPSLPLDPALLALAALDFPNDVLTTPVRVARHATDAIDHNGQPPHSTTLGEFVASLSASSSTAPQYLFDRASFFDLAPRSYAAPLLRAINDTLPPLPRLPLLPPLPHGWRLADESFASSYLLIGANGTSTSFHAHGATSHLLLRGTKLWYLAEPGSATQHRDPRGLDTFRVWKTRRPQISTLLLQTAGTVVALPAGWRHAVLNLGTTVAIARQRLLDPEPTARLLNAAYQLEAKNESAAAVALLATIAAPAPKAVEAAMGRLHLGRGELADAVRRLAAAKPLGRSDACVALTRHALAVGDAAALPAALRACDAAVRRDRWDATARVRRAETLRSLAAAVAAGRVATPRSTPRALLKAANAALERALELAPTRAAIAIQLAEARTQMAALLPTLVAIESRNGGGGSAAAVGTSDPRALWRGARDAHRRAIAIAPNRAVLRAALAFFLLDDPVLAALGEEAQREGVAALRTAARLDPEKYGATVRALLKDEL